MCGLYTAINTVAACHGQARPSPDSTPGAPYKVVRQKHQRPPPRPEHRESCIVLPVLQPRHPPQQHRRSVLEEGRADVAGPAAM